MKPLRLLVVTYHFPPEASVGGDRPFSLWRHAEAAGLEVTVATASNWGRFAGESRIVRAEAIDGWSRPSGLLRKSAWKLMTKAFEPALGNLDFYWMKELAALLRRRDLRRDFDAIHAIYPPDSALRTSIALARHSGLPLVVDYTDSPCFEPLEPLNRLQRAARLRMERQAARLSPLQLAVGRRMTAYLRETYPGTRSECVHNGFEPDEFEGLPPARPREPGRFVLAHFGGIGTSRERSTAPLWEGIRRLLAARPEAAEGLRLELFGRYTAAEEAEARSLAPVVRLRGFVPRREGFSAIRTECDGLLLYGVPGQASIVTSKVLEYFALGLPIVGICRGNEAGELIEEAGAGACCGFDGGEVAALLESALDARMPFAPRAEIVASYRRDAQTRRIAEHIREALGK